MNKQMFKIQQFRMGNYSAFQNASNANEDKIEAQQRKAKAKLKLNQA